MQINRGKFQENGNSGYVLKPECLIVSTATGSAAAAVTVTVNVISAYRLPKPKGQKKGVYCNVMYCIL